MIKLIVLEVWLQNKYDYMVDKHLVNPEKEIERDKVREIFKKARELVDEIVSQISKMRLGNWRIWKG